MNVIRKFLNRHVASENWGSAHPLPDAGYFNAARCFSGVMHSAHGANQLLGRCLRQRVRVRFRC